MSGQVLQIPVFRAVDNNGNALVGGQLWTYAAGTTTPQASYTDSTLGTPNTNPVILNARGEANVWLSPGLSYKIALQDASGNAIWTVDNINGSIFNQNFTGGATDVANILLDRTANYSGGTPGFVNSCLKVETDVTGAGATAYEWAFLALLKNSATAGQNVASYAQGNRVTSSTGPTWAAVAEVREQTPINDPTTGLVGLEVDNRSNGTDANVNRIGIDVVCARYNASGAPTQVSYGIRVQNNADSSVKIKQGVGVIANNVDVGFDTSIATINIAAYRMASGQSIVFDGAAGNNQLLYDGTGINYKATGATASRLNADGSIALGGSTLPTKLVGTSTTGSTAPTLTANKPGASTGINSWLSVFINGTQCWIPAWTN